MTHRLNIFLLGMTAGLACALAVREYMWRRAQRATPEPAPASTLPPTNATCKSNQIRPARAHPHTCTHTHMHTHALSLSLTHTQSLNHSIT